MHEEKVPSVDLLYWLDQALKKLKAQAALLKGGSYHLPRQEINRLLAEKVLETGGCSYT